jgi:putative membrane protein
VKKIFRRIAIYTFTLFVLPGIIPGVTISGGILTLIIGGIGLALLFLILKPILNLISLPVNFLTLGLFSIFTNALIIYLLTIFVTGITIHPFTYSSFSISGFTTPDIHFNLFFAYVFTAFVISLIESALSWLMN